MSPLVRHILEFGLDAASTSTVQELINVVSLAMRHGIKVSELRESIYTHPGSTEAFNEVLGTYVR